MDRFSVCLSLSTHTHTSYILFIYIYIYIHTSICVYCYAVLCLVTQSCPTRWDLIDCSPPGSSVRGDSPGKNTGVGCHALLQGIFPTQGSNPGSPALQVDSLPAGKPKNTGVGNLSLLQGIFPTQESNWGLLHCKWILYHLNYQGSPESAIKAH